MKESKKRQEVLFEVDLGYTDNYQDKDVISGLSNEEPSNHGTSWHKGVPTGTEKPWAGPSEKEGNPFDKQVDECGMADVVAPELAEEEMPATEEPMEEASMTMSNKRTNIERNAEDNGHERKMRHRNRSGVNPTMNESKNVKDIKKENKELKEAIVALRKNLNEAYITNVNLGKITKLFLENTTSQAEKVNIVNRFSDEAKTVEQSNKLYESISKELKGNKQTAINLNESSATAKGTKELNENKVYKSNDLLKTLDLMKRMNNI